MAGMAITCPSCDANLKLKTEKAPGTKLRCPRCEDVIVIPAPEKARVSREKPQPKKKRSPQPTDRSEERPRKRRKKKKESNKKVLFGLIGGGLVLILGVVLFKVLTAEKEETPPPNDDTSKPIITEKPKPKKSDAEVKKLLVGQWRSTKGKDTPQTFLGDGTFKTRFLDLAVTGTYVLKPNQHVEINMKLRGREIALKYRIAEISETHLTLFNTQDSEVLELERVKAVPKAERPNVVMPKGPANSWQAHKTAVTSFTVSPSGLLLASGGADKLIKLWDAKTGVLKATLQGHTSAVMGVAFSSDEKTLYSVSSLFEFFAWDLASSKTKNNVKLSNRIHQLTADHPHSRFATIGVAVEGQNAVTEIQVWDENLQQQHRFVMKEPGMAVVLTPDEKYVFASNLLGSPKAFDLTLNQPINLFPASALGSHKLAISKDGKTLAVSHVKHSVTLWNLTTKTRLDPIAAHGQALVTAMCINPDGSILATGGENTSVNLWDIQSGFQIANFRGHTKRVDALTFSKDGKSLYSGSMDESIKMWDLTPVIKQRDDWKKKSTDE